MWTVVTLPEWYSGLGIPESTLGAVPPASFFDTAEKEGGKVSSRASFANEEGITSGMGYTRAATGFQVIKQSLFILGTSTSAGYTRSWTSSCRQVVIDNSSFIPGHQLSFVYTRSSAIPCFTREKRAIHTSGHGVGSASSACTLQRSDFWAACVCGAWASAIHALGQFWAASFLQPSSLRDVQNGRGPFRRV